MSQGVGNPHDQLFREVFSRKETAIGFVQAYWPPEIVAELNLDSLECVRESFVDEELRASQSDLIYRVEWSKKPAYLYLLFEHQSRADRWMPLRLLGYMVRLWNRWLQEEGSKGRRKKLPPILPLVLHQGKKAWGISRQFADLIQVEPVGIELLQGYVPHFAYELVDLSPLPIKALRGEVLGRLTLALMKAVREEPLEEVLAQIAPWMQEVLRKQQATEIVEMWLRYLAETSHKPLQELQELLVQTVDPVMEEPMLTTAERLRREGERKGRQEGQMEKALSTAKELLQMGILNVAQIAQATKLPLQEVQKLANSPN